MRSLLLILCALVALASSARANPPFPSMLIANSSDPCVTTQANQYITRLASPPTGSIRIAQCNFINQLVFAGVWSTQDAIYLFANTNDANALTNLVSSSYTATRSNGGFSTSSAGYSLTTANYINTNFNPSTVVGTNFTQNSASIAVYSNTGAPASGSQILVGQLSVAQNTRMFLNQTGGNGQCFAGLNTGAGGGYCTNAWALPLTPFFIMDRNAASGAGSFNVYTDGAIVYSPNTASGAMLNANLLIGCSNTTASCAATTGAVVGLAALGGNMTDAQAINFGFAFKNYYYVIGNTAPATWPTEYYTISGVRGSLTAGVAPYITRLPNGNLYALWNDTPVGSSAGIKQQTSSTYGTWGTATVPQVNGVSLNPTAWSASVDAGTTQMGGAVATTIGSNIWLVVKTVVGSVYKAWIAKGSIVGGVPTWSSAPSALCAGGFNGNADGCQAYGIMLQLVGGNLAQVVYPANAGAFPGTYLMISSDATGQSFTSPTQVRIADTTSSFYSSGDVYSETACVVLQGSGLLDCVVRIDNSTTGSRTGYWEIFSTDNTGTAFNSATWTQIYQAAGATPQCPSGTVVSCPGGHTLVQAPSGNLFMLGRFNQPNSIAGSSSHQTGYVTKVSGVWVSTPLMLLSINPSASYGSYGYSNCIYDVGYTNKIQCSVAFGNNTEPSLASSIMAQVPFTPP